MIISSLLGGLGNQMFRYSVGRALSLNNNTTLRLEISRFDGKVPHNVFELHRIFDCPAEIATEEDVHSILGWQSISGIKRIMAYPHMEAFRRNCFIVEPHFHYWPEITNTPRDCYLEGNWQSEKYFQNVVARIRADFTFKNPLANLNAEVAEQIGQVNAVSLHVRRGDYVKNPKNTATHGLCSLAYYWKAIHHISDRVRQPYFFIFSDDIDWVKYHLKMSSPCQYVDHNHGEESYNDMRLMSMCQHHIIANSSFSWWGAWLNPSQEKIVISPKKWFANGNDVGDLFPHGWITL